ncbi:MAG TPA: TetR/AcrR family transcriptional regulator [Steroidobacteraceae bacterium]|nr:TetR/AcrR family transcriptional regulator [Steroidobacteraceae bacterium]
MASLSAIISAAMHKRAPASSPLSSSTAGRVLDVAEHLMQTRGFNGFSYADISGELGISKATLHHHFATKAKLGHALIERYSDNFRAALAAIDTSNFGAPQRLERYVQLYRDVLSGKRLCLCGMLAAEYGTLPEPMQESVRHFFDANETWIAGVIAQGRRAGVFQLRGSAADVARMLLGALEGAMLVARPFNDVERFSSAARVALAGLKDSRHAASSSRQRRVARARAATG